MGAAAAALGMAAASVALVAGPASAHDQLIGTDPADGSTVTALPAEVTLTFNDVVIDDPTGTQLRVADASGASLVHGERTVEDNVVTQRLRSAGDGVPGRVTVEWRVVSRDGHPVAGEFSFTVTGAPSSSPTASAPPAGTASSTPRQSPAPSTATGGGGAGASPAPWIVLGAGTIAAIAGAAYLLLSRTRRGGGASAADGAGSGDDSDR